jgi:hypothetical protein
MHSAGSRFFRGYFKLLLAGAVAGLFFVSAHAQDDGVGAQNDGGVSYTRNEELLESIFVPTMAHAPFSLTLNTEWSRRMANGGTYTVTNSRPIKRDSVGRLYQERWLLEPKGSKIPSQMSWIQIADPVEHTLYECTPRQHVCELRRLTDSASLRFNPDAYKTGPLPGGRGGRTHEDLGADFYAGLPVHRYRDTSTINPGAMGNDLVMSTVREYRFSTELGFNLTSVLDTPSLGRQMFTVTDITTTEPDPHFFLPPEGYRIVDYRKTPVPTN